MKFKSIFELTKSVFFVIVLIVSLIGCKKVFDQPHIGAITTDEVWNNPDNVALYVNQFYSILPAWNRNEVYSEEAGTINSFLNAKQQSSSAFPDNIDWNTAYSRIRAINTFFQNINKVPGMDKARKDALMGQVYFFRAYQYYSMVKLYGGVPIITDVQSPIDNTSTMVARNTTLDCFNYIAKNLDSAITLLPHTWGASDLGRVSKGAAMVVKGQTLMLKASPLFCPKQNHPEFWTEAYNAYNDALTELNSNGFGLYTKGGNKAYQNMWYDKSGATNEMVLYVRYADPTKNNGFQAGQRPLSVSAGSAGACQPTWEMVKAYPMINGKNIDEPGSGYSKAYFWKNRDPRFSQTIVYNGANYGFATNTSRIQWMFPGAPDDGYLGPYQRSGFYTRKEIDTTFATADLSKQAFDWPVIRYAEVLLDLAECANETGNGRIAKDNLILIRKRAGIVDDGGGNYGLALGVGSDYQATLNALMKERQIELAFEGKRFWDLRRRRLFSVLNSQNTWHAYGPYLADTRGTAADTTGKKLHDYSAINSFLTSLVLNPPKGVSKDSILRAATLYKEEVITRSTDNSIMIPDTYYFWPISTNYIQKDKNLIQNIGWDNGTFNPIIP
ncbi:RagB/SusD family nutrient uptake outer membrane protein [Pedobacter nutrimenti]|uniref:RagB/SusD family nutrient uptake outer membrane protein n=1 Tax=Pedobacter nutrimenti TaxID=1241337 RepID=UPI00292F8123|nr:RagB/SusD family nutrient uptake outer membrane protein [Pedobacter nutrimenti]